MSDQKENLPTQLNAAEVVDAEKLDLIDDVSVVDVFSMPTRNWNQIIQLYNKNNRKFLFTPLQCKVIIQYVIKGLPPQHLFKTLGISQQKFTSMSTKAVELQEQYDKLAGQENLSDEDYELLTELAYNPLRILMSDIERAEGLADLEDFERFNLYASKGPDIHLAKMKAKFKDLFSDREQDRGQFNVQINLGGDWIEDI